MVQCKIIGKVDIFLTKIKKDIEAMTRESTPIVCLTFLSYRLSVRKTTNNSPSTQKLVSSVERWAAAVSILKYLVLSNRRGRIVVVSCTYRAINIEVRIGTGIGYNAY